MARHVRHKVSWHKLNKDAIQLRSVIGRVPPVPRRPQPLAEDRPLVLGHPLSSQHLF